MIAIIGAGITGLTLGYRLQQRGIPFRIFDASGRIGGNLWSDRQGEYLLEKGPNSLMMNDRIWDLLAELGLTDQILEAAPEAKYRYVLRDGKYRKLPSGPISFLFSGTFRWKEKMRALRERKLPAGHVPGETADAFFRRRFGDALADYGLGPFVSGIYAGDPKSLLMEAAFPRILKMEAEHQSVIRGFSKGKREEHRGVFSLKGGLENLPKAIAAAISDSIQLNSPLAFITPIESGYLCEFKDPKTEPFHCEKLVFAIPAHPLAALLSGHFPEFSNKLKAIPYPAVSLVHSIWKKSQAGHKLNGFGALNNHLEPSKTLGTIFSSTVFPGRCPADQVMLTSFVGGAKNPEAANFSPEQIFESAQIDLKNFLEVSGKPVKYEVTSYASAIPQYTAGILETWEMAENLDPKKLFFAGNWIGGISVPNCLDRAQLICEQLTD